MTKSNFINLIDKLFISITLFIIIYAWVNFYILDLWTTFILSLIFSSAILYVIFFLSNKRKSKTNRKASLSQDIDKKFLAFQLLSQEQKLNLIELCLSKKCQVKKYGNQICYNNQGEVHAVVIPNQIIDIDFANMLHILSGMDIKNVDVIHIVCNNVKPNTPTNIINKKKIEFITKEILYNQIFADSDTFPDDSNIANNVCKLKIVDIVKMFINPKRAKAYFFSGAVLIFSSIILPFFTYYLIVGSILLIMCLICKIIPLFKT